MAVPQSKAELIQAINKNFARLEKKLQQVPAEVAFQPLLPGHVKHSVISVAQLVSYLIGWGELVLHWHQQEADGQTIAFPAAGYKWNQLGQLAQKFYQDYATITDYAELLQRLEQNKNQLLQLIEQFSDDKLYQQAWYGKWTRGRMIQFNTASPYSNAAGRLNKLPQFSRH